MRLTSIAVFGVGYVLGTKAGRERYAQIVQAAQKTSERLASYDRSNGKPSERLAEYIRTAARDTVRG
jgi:hypothetical protein